MKIFSRSCHPFNPIPSRLSPGASFRWGARAEGVLRGGKGVRLAGAAGDPLAVTKAKAGDRVLVAFDDRGTHVGGRISVRVDER